MAAHSFRVVLHVLFQNFMLSLKILYVSTNISEIFAAALEPFHDFRLSTPSQSTIRCIRII